MFRILCLSFSLVLVSVAHAAPSEETLACVEASTRGQTERDDGKLLAAREQFRVCARESCPQIVRESCRGWLRDVEERVPSAVLRVYDEDGKERHDVTASLDGAPVELGQPVQLEPGVHAVHVEGPDRTVDRKFGIGEREYARLIAVELARPPVVVAEVPAAPPPMTHLRVPVASWVLTGVGVASIALFTGLRTKAANDLHTLQHDCAPTCSDAQRDDGKRLALSADVMLGVGIAALGGAAAWTLGSWLARRSDRRTALIMVPERAGASLSLTRRY